MPFPITSFGPTKCVFGKWVKAPSMTAFFTSPKLSFHAVCLLHDTPTPIYYLIIKSKQAGFS